MTERRPHWDDDLINAVRTAMRPRILTCTDTIDTYDVIAAVEDWQSEHGINIVGTAIADHVTRLNRAESAIQRVRELCEQTTVSVSIGCRCYTDECSGTCGAGRPLSWHLNPAAVLAALDGDSDE